MAILCSAFSPVASPARRSPKNHAIAGLKQPAEILVDKWGVAHIYAKDFDAAFFVQGFNAAHDKAFSDRPMAQARSR